MISEYREKPLRPASVIRACTDDPVLIFQQLHAILNDETDVTNDIAFLSIFVVKGDMVRCKGPKTGPDVMFGQTCHEDLHIRGTRLDG